MQETDSDYIKDNLSCRVVFATSGKKLSWLEFVANRCSVFSYFDLTWTNKCYRRANHIVYSKQRSINLNTIGRFARLTKKIVCQAVDL